MIHLLLIAMLGMAGCYSAGNASIKNQDLVAQVQIGKSTRDDVRRLLGEPSSISKSSAQVVNPNDSTQMLTVVEWWSYIHASARVDGRSFIPVVGPFLGGTSHESEHFQVGFDQKGLVQQVTSGATKGKSGVFGSQ